MTGVAAFPALFVSHGSPMIALGDTPATRFLRGLGARIDAACGRPKAILCVSAHWETTAPAVTGNSLPETIHDFYGFPPELYALRYPAPGAPDLARRAAALVQAAGLACTVESDWGLDHGAWIPLSLMWPKADIPVVQLAIQQPQGPAHHLRLGQALAPLRREGVLVLGSGGAVHNIRDALLRAGRGDTATPDWAEAFVAWLDTALTQDCRDDLVDYRRRAPAATQAHPRDEHLLPLFVAFGAGGTPARRLHASFDLGSMAMAAWGFGAEAAAL